MLTPTARGALSTAVLDALRGHDTASLAQAPAPDDDDDAHITLWSLFALHHAGFDDVDDDLEWDPQLIALRGQLTAQFERELRDRAPAAPEPVPHGFAEELFAFISAHVGPSAAEHLQRDGTREQMLEFLRHRSIYSLKESDHSMWALPRLTHRVKAHVMELQYDEYGGGAPHRLHAYLFARGLAACGLSADLGAYIDEAPMEVLAQDNAMSMFGLTRRLRGASLGFLGAFEATSSAPSRRIARALGRLGLPAEMIEYYTEHVEADAVHEQLAIRIICGTLLEETPQLHDDVWFGAWACLHMDDLYAARMLERWTS